MAKHDIVVLNSTSSGFETDLGNNVARIKGDADDLFQVRDASGVNKFAVSSAENSMIIGGDLTLTGNLSSSLNSTASFGKIDAVIVGDASQMTNVNEQGHVSSSAQLAARISGAFQAGFVLEGENRVISGSATSTGSFTRVFANVYSGDASDMFNTNEDGHISSSTQLASNISGAFTSGFTSSDNSEISGSATSTGSFGRVNISGVITGNASQVTGVTEALPSGLISGSGQIASRISGSFNKGFVLQNKAGQISGSATSTGSFGLLDLSGPLGLNSSITDTSEITGIPSLAGFISSSAQIASYISGSFTSGMGMNNSLISGSATSTGSFGLVDNIVSITGDASQVTGLTLPSGLLSSSAQMAADISGSFTSGFEFDNSISGSATSTGSFSRLNFNSLSVTDLSGVTGHEAGHLSSSAQIASNISASFQGGFNFTGEITGSSTSTLKIQSLNIAGTSTFGSTNLVKNWDTNLVKTATFGTNLASAISGAFNAGFAFEGTISGSATSTGSFSRIQSQELFVKEMFGERKPISGSMNHDIYISGSYKTNSHGRVTIPIFGRGHTVNTQQFTATGSMESQKYRARAGQLFVDNFGHLNMTVQTGSMVAVAGAWEAGPTTILTNAGGAATAGTRDAFIMGAPFTPAHANSGSAIYDGISWTRVSDATAGHGAQNNNCSIGSVDAALFLNASGGIGNGTNTGRYGSFPYAGAHTTYMELWDGVGYYRGAQDSGTHVKRNGAGGKVGSVNSHIVFNGSDYLAPTYPTAPGTADWNGVTWQEAGPGTPTRRNHGGGFGGVYDGVYAGGEAPNNTCVDEWNGTTWATAAVLPTAQAKGGGVGNQNAGGIMGGSPAREVQLYNGTAWSEGTSTPYNMAAPSTQGTAGRAHLVQTNCTMFWTGEFITGSADTYNNFSQNPTGRYLLTKKLQANYSSGCTGGGSTSNDEDFGGGY